MKQLFTVIISLTFGILFETTISAQSPETMSYQAVVRDADDQILINQSVGMQISILQGSVDGIPVYVERHFPTTNANGLVTIVIGNGTAIEGGFAEIDWTSGPYFLKTETDLNGGANYTIAGTSQLLSVPYALHAKTAENVTGEITETDPTVKKYSVGDFAHGGIVFWVDESGQHGLVCAKEDQNAGSGIQWYNEETYSSTTAEGDGVYAGEMNTMLIIINQGYNSNDYAAGVCANYTVRENGVTYGDWYLPSSEELNLMYQNKATIDATAVANGGSSFVIDYYWSSTESSFYQAGVHSFSEGIQGGGAKYHKLYVRAIRSF